MAGQEQTEQSDSHIGATMTVTTERRADNWIAFLNDDRAQWDRGRTQAEAIGACLLTHADVVRCGDCGLTKAERMGDCRTCGR